MNRRRAGRLSLLAAVFLLTAVAAACSADDGRPLTSTPVRTTEPSATPIPTPITDPDAVVLSWTRAGGIAGFCDGLQLTAGHRVTLGTCDDPPMSHDDGKIAPNASIIAFETWRSDFASFEVEWDDGPDVADGMAIHLSFVGRGTRVATENDRREIASFAGQLFSDISAAQPRAALTEAATARPDRQRPI